MCEKITVAKGGANVSASDAVDTPYRHFGEPTDGNDVKVLIDGRETFDYMYRDIIKAQQQIWITGLDLMLDLKMRRGSIKYQTKLAGVLRWVAEQNPGIQIRILLFHPSTLQQTAGQNNPEGIKKKLESMIPPASLKVKLDQTVVGVPILQSVPIIGPTYSGMAGAAHQKVVVIDGKIGYCGGLDLAFGRWDSPDHHYGNKQRDTNEKGTPAGPWHDIHARIVGPAVWDLQLNFLQRWFYTDDEDSKVIKEWEREQNKVGKYRSIHGSNGKCRVQVTRTWKQAKGVKCKCDNKCIYKDRDNDAFGIEQMYQKLFRDAKNFIYIENQYAFQNSVITDAFIRELISKPNLKAIIVLPMKPDLITEGKKWGVKIFKLVPIPIVFPSVWTFEGIPDLKTLNNNLKRIRDRSGGRVKTFCLVSNHGVSWTSQGGSSTVRENIQVKGVSIYVHAKLAICDDKFLTLGSANLDDWGLGASSEMNVLIDNPEIAKATRVRLWKEHLGDWQYQSSRFRSGDWWSWWGQKGRSGVTMDSLNLNKSDDSSFALELWDRLSMHNVSAVRDMLKYPETYQENWVGKIYPYAYKEMNLPEPFAGAEGGGVGGGS